MVLAIVLGVSLAPAQAGAPADKPLRKVTFLANYVFHGRNSPFFVGLEKGFYKEAGFDIQILPSTGSGFVFTAVDGGKADYGMAESTSVTQVIAKRAKGKGFTVFMDITTSGLASLTPYPTPESLNGKTVAASLTDSARVILLIIFSQKGVDPNIAKWLAADPGVYFALLLENKVDLFTASINGDVPALMRVATPQGKTIHFTSFADWGYDVFGYFLVSSADKVAKSPDEVRAFSVATSSDELSKANARCRLLANSLVTTGNVVAFYVFKDENREESVSFEPFLNSTDFPTRTHLPGDSDEKVGSPGRDPVQEMPQVVLHGVPTWLR